MPKTQFSGSCHCGKAKFSFLSEPIDRGARCNCSICSRKGIVMTDFYIPTNDFKYDFSSDHLGNYLWNDHVLNHYFCKTCGVTPFIGAAEYGYRANLGCVDGVDPLSLKIRLIDGKSMPVRED